MGDKEGLGNEKEVTGTGISVIIPVYNAEKYIARCLESVIKQGPVVTEIICVDDGSSDAACHMIEAAHSRRARRSEPCEKYRKEKGKGQLHIVCRRR